MAERIGVYAFQRQLSRRITAVEHGGPPLLIVRRRRWVALLVSVELGLQNTPAVRELTHVAVTKLASDLSSVLKMVRRDRRAVVVTRHRRSVAMLIPADGPLMDAYRITGPDNLEEILRQLREAPGPSMEEILDQFRGGAEP